jgi:hypothetical protein
MEDSDVELSRFELLNDRTVRGRVCTNKNIPTTSFIIKVFDGRTEIITPFEIKFIGKLNGVLYQYEFIRTDTSEELVYNRIVISVTDDSSADVYTHIVSM